MHRGEVGGHPHDAEGAHDGQAADDGGQAGRDDGAEDEEQHHRDQRDGRDLGALLVLADGAGELAGDGLQAGELNLAVVDGLKIRLDDLVVLEDGVVVVALERHDDERARAVVGEGLVGGRVARRIGQVALPGQNLVGVVLDDLVELGLDFLRPLRVVGLLAIRRVENGHDVAEPVTSVDLVGQLRRGDRLTGLVVETALSDVLPQACAVDAAAHAQRDHDSDHYVSESVHHPTPPGEHVSS